MCKDQKMDDKQLDLNAPLLSVRRLSTASSKLDGLSSKSSRKSRIIKQNSLQISKTDWEQPECDVTKPAAVPFLWEQIPGKAKHRKTIIDAAKLPSKASISSDGEEDVYADAMETLSSSESFSEMASSGSFCSDVETRDYLMNRFLPAAKSMIVETPLKKQEPLMAEVTVTEPPKYVKKVYSGELRPLLLENYPINVVSRYDQSENDKDSDEFDEIKKKSRKSFGFFLPRICVKNSLCMLNPMTGPKSKIHQSDQSPVTVPYSPGQVPRLSRRTSYSGPLTPSIEKQNMDAMIKKRAESRPKEAHETRIKLSPLNHSSDSLSSPNRGSSRSGRISPYRNESPRSPFHDGAQFLGMPKDVRNETVQPKTCPSLNVKSHFSPRLIPDKGSSTVSPMAIEKTLYVDRVDKLATPKIEGNGNLDDLEGPRVPPLPKSPSESWLWRTMKSPFPKKQVDKSPKTSPNWETLVKTSNVHHDHVRYSEELLRVSQHSDMTF